VTCGCPHKLYDLEVVYLEYTVILYSGNLPSVTFLSLSGKCLMVIPLQGQSWLLYHFLPRLSFILVLCSMKIVPH